MKTIEEKVKEMMAVGRFDVFCWQGELPEQKFRPSGKYVEYALAEKAVMRAVRELRKEFTRWHDPKVELPEIPDGKNRSKKVLLKKESGDYVAGWVEFINGNARWTDARVVFQNIIGWREIHE